MRDDFKASGATDPFGIHWIRVSQGNKDAYLRRSEFAAAATHIAAKLAAQGVFVIGPKNMATLVAQVASVQDFPDAPIISRPGWSGSSFALPSGELFLPDGKQQGVVAFGPVPNKCSVKGTLKGWKNGVAKPLGQQKFGQFLLSLAFLPPLMKFTDRIGNLGFEIQGPSGTGKSTLQMLMSSILGGASQGDDGHYWIGLEVTLNGLEQMMQEHSDLPIIFDEATLLAAGASTKERTTIFKALTSKLITGDNNVRPQEPGQTGSRHCYVISTNEPLLSLLGQDAEVVIGAADRLVTIPLNVGRPFGAFDTIPEPYKSGSEFASALMNAANEHHGQPIRKFLNALVKAYNEDEGKLRHEIANHVAEFCRRASVDQNNGSAVRRAESFGLVYAAGKIAQKYNVLPKNNKLGPSILSCYRLHFDHAKPPKPLAIRLLELSEQPSTIKWSGKKRPTNLGDAAVIVRKGDSGFEIWIKTKGIEQIFSDWGVLKKSSEFRSLVIGDNERDAVYRNVGAKGSRCRVFRFKLPDPILEGDRLL